MTTYVSDTFNRADETPLAVADIGGTWVSENHGGGAGVWSVVSNKAKVSTGAVVSGENTTTLDATIADCTISVDMDFALGSNNEAIAFRVTDGQNWNMGLVGPAGNFQWWRILTGSYAQVGSNVTGQPTSGIHQLKIVLSGSTWTAFVDSVQIDQQLGATNQQTATRHGLRAATSDISPTFDNFLVTDGVVAVAGPAPLPRRISF